MNQTSSPTADRADPARLSGSLLAGRYRIGRLLGSGAMGLVYAAEHLELGRTCAVKVIRHEDPLEPAAYAPDATDRSAFADMVERFRMEALAASRLDHPNVLRVLDFGSEAGEGGDLWYLVTEHLDGEDLVDLLAAQGRLSLPHAIEITRQLCSALAHAHDRGVVHRDVKPENVRLARREDDDGHLIETVKLIDFGTAQVDTEPAASQLVVGTPAYMSPEQAAGSQVDPRSDIYSVGVMLFELATGRLPFEASSPIEVAAAHLERRPPAPRSVNPEVDPELESIILWCLRKRPSERPQTARALRDALDRITQRSLRRRPTGGLTGGLTPTLRVVPAPDAPLSSSPGEGWSRSRGDAVDAPPSRKPRGERRRRQSATGAARRRAPTLLTVVGAAGLAASTWLLLGRSPLGDEIGLGAERPVPASTPADSPAATRASESAAAQPAAAELPRSTSPIDEPLRASATAAPSPTSLHRDQSSPSTQRDGSSPSTPPTRRTAARTQMRVRAAAAVANVVDPYGESRATHLVADADKAVPEDDVSGGGTGDSPYASDERARPAGAVPISPEHSRDTGATAEDRP